MNPSDYPVVLGFRHEARTVLHPQRGSEPQAGTLSDALAVHGGSRLHTFTEFTANPRTLRDLAAGITCMPGFTRMLPSVLLFVFYGGAFGCLSFALRSIDVSVAYGIWSALGLVIVSAIGILVLNEGAGAFKLASIAVIVAGVIGLYWSGGGH